jgi:lysophospholipase L1-like esterase
MTRPLLAAIVLSAISGWCLGQTQSPATNTGLPTCPEIARALSAAVANDARLSDFANLARYREANKSVAGADVVFIGDSITDSWQQAQFGGFFPGKHYINRGISGQTTPQMLLRFRADVLNLKPRVVVILAGTNDIAGNTGPATDEEIEGYLASMAQLAAANGVKVVLSSILPVSSYHPSRSIPQTTLRPMIRIEAINTWIRSYAAANGHVYLDYFSAVTDSSGLLKSDFSNDDLHPTKAGYDAMAPLAEAAIAKAYGKAHKH